MLRLPACIIIVRIFSLLETRSVMMTVINLIVSASNAIPWLMMQLVAAANTKTGKTLY